MHWRRKWQPTPVFLPGESQGRRSLAGLPSMGSHRVRHDWSDLAAAAAGPLHLHLNVMISLLSFLEEKKKKFWDFSRDCIKSVGHFEESHHWTRLSLHEQKMCFYLLTTSFLLARLCSPQCIRLVILFLFLSILFCLMLLYVKILS